MPSASNGSPRVESSSVPSAGFLGKPGKAHFGLGEQQTFLSAAFFC